MTELVPHRRPNAAQKGAAAAAAAVHRLLAREAMGGAVLLFAACAALLLANSPWHGLYQLFTHLPIYFGVGGLQISVNLHFLVNDVLMTLFFLAVGAEIRQELYDGALSDIRRAILPLIAAFGGVALPALIYLAVNAQSGASHGWAVPTATDIAFAVGVLALLGRSVPADLRIILLSLAVIDDIIAVLIIACFYSDGLVWAGLYIAAGAVILVLILQFFGLSSVPLYAAAGALLWFGLWKMGVHPSLAGVVLGLLTPVLPLFEKQKMQARLELAVQNLSLKQVRGEDKAAQQKQTKAALAELKKLAARAEPAAARLSKELHFWVAFGVMPLFAFVNAGVRIGDVALAAPSSAPILFGIIGGLVLGKPLGVLGLSFVAVKLKLCRLPLQLDWSGMVLVGLLAGIGFTMAIFVSMLAFQNGEGAAIAALAVLCGSAVSAVLGLLYGVIYCRCLLKKPPKAA